MPLRETELESEFEDEAEFEDEFEGEEEGEDFDLGGVISGLLGESEYEEEYEGEEEGEEFDLGGVISGLLGESEDEGEFEDEASYSMTESEAMAEMMAAIAAGAESEAEAEAMIGAATMTVLSARDRAELNRLLPHLVRASCVLTRLLRRRSGTRPAVAAVPYIVKGTARDLTRIASDGRPVSRRTAARVMSRRTRGVLGSPRRTATALQRNARATRAVRRTAASKRRYTRRPRRHVHRRRAYSYR
jgi:hypothetical protein